MSDWISVEDSLPEDGEYVLASTRKMQNGSRAKSGQPKHPLYLKKDLDLVEYRL